MNLVRAIVAISAFWLSVAHAQEVGDTITLARGEMIEVHLDRMAPSGGVVVTRGPAPAMPAGAQAGARQMAETTVVKPTQEIVTLPGAREGALPIPNEAVRFTFAQVPDSDDVVLTVENGYQRALSYRAIMTVNGRRQPTDVCLVPPSQAVYEHWPHQIDSIDVFDLTAHDWSPGDPRPCR